MKNLSKMFYFGFISFLYILAIEVFFIFILLAYDKDRFKYFIGHNDYYSKLNHFESFYAIFQNNSVIFYVLFILLCLVFLVLLSIGLLKAINPSYTIENLQSKKLYLKILFFFFSNFIIFLCFFVLARFITNFLIIGWLSLLINALISILILTLFILYWHRDGLVGDLRFCGEKLKLKLRRIPGAIKTLSINKPTWFFKILFIWLIIEFFIFYVFYIYFNYLFPYFIYASLMEVILYQEFLNIIILILPLIFSISLILIYLVINNLQESFKNIFLKVIPVIVILSLLLITTDIGYKNFLDSIDYYKKLPAETGVELSQEDFYNTAIILGENHEVFLVEAQDSYYMDTDSDKYNFINYIMEYNKEDSYYFYNFFNSPFVIQCSEDNINKVEGLKPYLESKNYQTLLINKYYYFLINCYKSNWETAKYTDFQKLILERISLDIGGFAYTGKQTSWASYDEQEVELFKTFLNSGDYYIGKSFNKNIADKLLHYNEIDEAKKWFDKTDEDLGQINFSIKSHQGRIVGKLEINEEVKDKIRVGLLGRNLGGNGMGVNSDRDKRLVASTNIDDEGNFVFDNLFEGSYFLAVLIKEAKIEQENIIIEKTAPIIEISSDNYDYDIGEIEIILVD